MLQRNDYYAFGSAITSRSAANSPKNNYLYNGKELQEETDWYDYEARHYDPVIGRWTGVDVLAEISMQWSPYTYGKDNPIRYIDPTGMGDKDSKGGNKDDDMDDGMFGSGQDIFGRDKYDSKSGLYIPSFERGDIDWSRLARASATQNRPQSKEWDQNKDGFLTLTEANIWYRKGNGKSITVPASNINLSNVNPNIVKGMKIGTVFPIHLLKSNFYDDGVVYGTLDARYLGGLKIEILPNKYDFDIGESSGHPWKKEFIRNIATWLGLQEATGFGLAGNGNPYMIYFSGTATIGQGSSWPNYPWKR